MHPKYITFSVNEYDRDGDATDEGIFLHFNDCRVKAADNINDFRSIVEHMEAMVREIEENYSEANAQAELFVAPATSDPQQQRKPLPKAEIERLVYEHAKLNPNQADDLELLGYIVNAVRAVEAAHNIGGDE